MKNKFVNPKGIKGNQRIDRMINLMGIKTITESVIDTKSLENLKYGPDGKTYGIVRENKRYFIKISDKTTNVTLNDLDYIGGLGNKMNESFTSYNDAIRRLNLKFNELNSFYGNKENIDVLKMDVVITENVIDEERYTIKVPAPAAPAPAPIEEPAGDELGDIGMEDELEPAGEEDLEVDDEGDEDEEDIIKAIQKLTGKLGQKIREANSEEMNSEMTKYVLNSTMSALDLSLLSEEDIEEAIERLEAGEEQLDDELGGEEEEGGMEEPMGDEFPEEAGEEEMELAEDEEPSEEKEQVKKKKKTVNKSKSAPKSTKKSNTKAFYEGGTIVKMGESTSISKKTLLESIDDYYEEDYEHVENAYEGEEQQELDDVGVLEDTIEEDCGCGDNIAKEEIEEAHPVFDDAISGDFYGSPQTSPKIEPGEKETPTIPRRGPGEKQMPDPNDPSRKWRGKPGPDPRPRGEDGDINVDDMDDIHIHLDA